ncbi:Uncharacterized protein TCM_004537 [Theobroma cacao]|uniref:Uncharacterized protein n=1 Tax=Theobroma cacao TaxID=3641 RepID=A0A061DR90_THECC|nr:Uncharacterized protein TCM_004537 [Theobroma cacao]
MKKLFWILYSFPSVIFVQIIFLDQISNARFDNKYGQYFLPRIAVWNQEKIDGWLTCIKDFKNLKNVQVM